jgi:hypothetical protein
MHPVWSMASDGTPAPKLGDSTNVDRMPETSGRLGFRDDAHLVVVTKRRRGDSEATAEPASHLTA